MTRSGLSKRIVASCYIRGSFILRSGKTSTWYLDKYQFESDPSLLSQIASEMVTLIPPGTEVLAGLELGGIPLATAISLQSQIPVAFVRKVRKTYGTSRIIEGTDVSGRHVCIVEDVITTGGQVIASAEELRANGAIVDGVICAIWRGAESNNELAQAGLKLYPLLSRADLALPESDL